MPSLLSFTSPSNPEMRERHGKREVLRKKIVRDKDVVKKKGCERASLRERKVVKGRMQVNEREMEGASKMKRREVNERETQP